MSVIGLDELQRRVKEDQLLENLSERELNNPEGTGFDLRIGKVFRIIEGGAFIEADSDQLGMRKGVKTEEIQPAEDKSIEIKPGEYYLIQTMETINTPLDLLPMPYGRGSLMKSGLLLVATPVAPGYSGFLVFGLQNFSQFSAKFQISARFAHIVFHKIEGQATKYRGQHQGGRVSIEEEERQV